jgi:hypothetical protein
MMGKRGNGEGSIYFQASKNRWAAAIITDGGKRTMIYGKTRQAVARKLNIAIENKQNGLPVADSQQRLGPYLQQWLETVIRPTESRRHTDRTSRLSVRIFFRRSETSRWRS